MSFLQEICLSMFADFCLIVLIIKTGLLFRAKMRWNLRPVAHDSLLIFLKGRSDVLSIRVHVLEKKDDVGGAVCMDNERST